MIFFDLEFYVPPVDRNLPDSRGSLVFNPAITSHLLLGGHFITQDLTNTEIREINSFWLWNFQNEEELLKEIKSIFVKEYQYQQGIKTMALKKRVKDIITCGFAIARIDLPTLFIRSQKHHIASDSELFQTFLKTKIIDLSNISAFLFPNDSTFYPKTAYEVSKKLKINTKWKPSGKLVWDYYDQGDYDKIINRCQHEVEEIREIYLKLQSEIALLP